MKKKLFSWLWKTIFFNGCNCMKKSKYFLAKSESKGTELSGVVNLLEVDIYNCYGVFYCDVSLSITDCC